MCLGALRPRASAGIRFECCAPREHGPRHSTHTRPERRVETPEVSYCLTDRPTPHRREFKHFSWAEGRDFCACAWISGRRAGVEWLLRSSWIGEGDVLRDFPERCVSDAARRTRSRSGSLHTIGYVPGLLRAKTSTPLDCWAGPFGAAARFTILVKRLPVSVDRCKPLLGLGFRSKYHIPSSIDPGRPTAV